MKRTPFLPLVFGILCGLVPAFWLVGFGPRVASAQDLGVTISGLAYQPPILTTTVGNTVRWTHQDGFSTHTVTADNGAFASPNLAEGDSFTATFTTTDVFTYHCLFHPGMLGVVNVIDLPERLYIPSLSRGGS